MAQMRKVQVVLEVMTDKPRHELESASTWDKIHKGYLKITSARVHADEELPSVPPAEEQPTDAEE